MEKYKPLILGTVKWGAAVLIIWSVIAMTVQYCYAASPKVEQCSQDKSLTAYHNLMAFITLKLQRPLTASFPLKPLEANHIGDCVYEVYGSVDAKNAYGTRLRTNWLGYIRYDPKRNEWSPISADLLK